MSNQSGSIGTEIDEKLKAIGGSNLDLRQGPPIHQKRTVTFVNHFVVSMVDFLNNFAQSCEHKLFQCDQRIRKLEDELCLLEAKLNSVPEVRDAVGTNGLAAQSPDESSSSIQVSDVKEPNSSSSSPGTGENKAGGDDHRHNGNQPNEVNQDRGSGSGDPTPPPVGVDITKYIKMVQFGVPRQAVKLKMQQEGLDPDLLDHQQQQHTSSSGENNVDQ